MTTSEIYVIKINLNNANRSLNDNSVNDVDPVDIYPSTKTIDDIIETMSPITPDKSNIVYMTKTQYDNYLLKNCGNIHKVKTRYDCELCNEEITKTRSAYTLNKCGHTFHLKCFKNQSKTSKTIKCPLCKQSNEIEI